MTVGLRPSGLLDSECPGPNLRGRGHASAKRSESCRTLYVSDGASLWFRSAAPLLSFGRIVTDDPPKTASFRFRQVVGPYVRCRLSTNGPCRPAVLAGDLVSIAQLVALWDQPLIARPEGMRMASIQERFGCVPSTPSHRACASVGSSTFKPTCMYDERLGLHARTQSTLLVGGSHLFRRVEHCTLRMKGATMNTISSRVDTHGGL